MSSQNSSPSSDSSSDESTGRLSLGHDANGILGQEYGHDLSSPRDLRLSDVNAAPSEYEDINRLPDSVDDGDEQRGFLGRREIDSDGSEYEPSNKTSSPEPEWEDRERRGSKSSDDDDDDDDDDNIAAAHRSSLKRPYETTSPEMSASMRHNKTKRRAINQCYLELLNDDIEDARRKYVPDDWPPLMTAQTGLTVWTAEEKELFYEAVTRLGRDDVRGIVARLGSKSEIEVRHYLHLLYEDAKRRRSRIHRPLLAPQLCEFPAATEISEDCCATLESEADLVARHESLWENKDEQRQWGPHWLLTGANCADITKAAMEIAGLPADEEASNQSPAPEEDYEARLAQLRTELRPEAIPTMTVLNVPSMLLVSERVFMNGVSKDANCLTLGGLPTAHMSALKDLYDLVYSVTQRLVATTIHIAQSRDRARQASSFKRLRKKVVRDSDVQTAISSLGLKKDSREFWARCPRRLGLHVSRSAVAFFDMDTARGMGFDVEQSKADTSGPIQHPDEDDGDNGDGGDGDGDDDIMSYDEIEEKLNSEDILGAFPTDVSFAPKHSPLEAEKDPSDDHDDSDSVSYTENTLETMRQRIEDETEEIVRYSATSYRDANRARRSLKSRISDELREEAYADAIDKHKSSSDEQYLWRMMGKADVGGHKVLDVENPSMGVRRYPVEQIVETGRDWRDKLQFEAEWEGTAAEAQLVVEEDAEGIQRE